ncbi:MAG: response regulator transcription factor [Puniceicoccaceae bacterium]
MKESPKPLILIVEDNPELRASIIEYLEHVGMLTQAFDRGAKAIDFLKNNHANLVLLDVNLPDFSGFELLREIRSVDAPPPVIFVTGLNNEISKVKGFEIGADDYLTKPFSNAELVARIRAVLRRSETAYDTKLAMNASVLDQPFTFCEARINPARLEINFPNGNTEAIGRKELGILALLANNPNQVISRKMMIHEVWGEHADLKSRSLDQYVVRIRDRFKEQECPSTAFRTIHGIGYIYDN